MRWRTVAFPARAVAAVLAIGLATSATPTALADTGVLTLNPRDYGDDQKLIDILWAHAPEVLATRSAAAAARAEAQRATFLPNPAVDATWGTIPLGHTTPRDLSDPLDRVPSYSVGVSELVEIGKRTSRQAATRAEWERSHQDSRAALADRFFLLLGAIGKVAKEQERTAVMDDLVSSSEQLLALDRARVRNGDIAAVDLNRAEVEHLRLTADRGAALTDLNAALSDCSLLAAAHCSRFPSGKAAVEFLEKAGMQSVPEQWSQEIEDRRADMMALRAAEDAATARLQLARNQALPDVTMRFGYTYDQFVASGNQRNSLSLGVQIPIPVSDHGQADQLAAATALSQAEAAHDSLAAAGRSSLKSVLAQRRLVLDRRGELDKALEKALSVREALTGAMQHGGADRSDVLLAQRAYRELVLDRTDLDAQLFDTTLRARQLTAMLPDPTDHHDEGMNP